MFRKFHFFLLILLLSSIFCFTNTFADENGDLIDIENIIAEGNFEFPTPDSTDYIQGNAEFQIVPEVIIGSPDFEKMRDLPTDSQDYQLGRKVGWILTPQRNNPGRYWACTGFLVGPDLLMTNHHCLHDDSGLLSLDGTLILMDYYQDRDVNPTFGGITARVSGIVKMDAGLDYALLRLDSPIGETYGWLELDIDIEPDNSSQSVKIISHPQSRAKEIARRNSQILALAPAARADFPYILLYLADTQGGSSGSPVFLQDGTGVIAIHHSGVSNQLTGEPLYNVGSLMSHIVPEIRQYLPSSPADPAYADLVVEAPMVSNDYLLPGGSFTLSATVRNQGDVDTTATTLRFYQSLDTTITISDIEVGTANVGALQPDATVKINIRINAPLTLGIHHYGACVDTVDNEANSDNNCSPSVALAVSDTLPVYMYYTDSGTNSIQRANLDGSNVRDIVTTGLSTPTDIAVDLTREKLYWTDSDTDKIQRANLDGSNIEDIVTTGLQTPTGIALDLTEDKVYWTDSDTDKIQRANLDGSNIEDIVTTGLQTPTSIALDLTWDKVYWTDSGTDKIQRANLDGSDIKDIVTTGLQTPTSIAFHPVLGELYWIDTGTNKIQRANLDGSNIKDIVTTGLHTPTSIALRDEVGELYWIDAGTDKIQRANLDGSNIEDIVTTGLQTPTSIALGIPQVDLPRPPGPGPGPGPGSLDVNGDGQVTVLDLAIVALFYGTLVPDGVSLPADVNTDGTVDITDLVTVAQAIDAADNQGELSADDVDAVLEAVVAQVNVIEAIPKAPARFSTSQHALHSGIAYRNVAAAFEAAQHLATDDVRLGKWMPMFTELLHLLTEMRDIPETTALLPNYPNPFNPETWIPYHLATDANVTLTIYDMRGIAVCQLMLGHQPAGIYRSKQRAAYWDGRNDEGEPVSSGVYFYTLTAGDFTATRKLLIIK